MLENSRQEQTIMHKCNLVLHPDVNPSFSPETIARDIQKPTQSGAQITTKLYEALKL